MEKVSGDTIKEQDLINMGYYQYLFDIVGCGGERELVDEKIYEKIPINVLSNIIKDYPENIIAKKIYAQRELEEILDMNDLDNYIKRFLETSDKSFIKDAIKSGLSVFVQLSNPKAKTYISLKKRLTSKIELLSVEELTELKIFFETYKYNFGRYTIDQLKEKFNKRIIIGKGGYSYQQNGVNEDSWIADIDFF